MPQHISIQAYDEQWPLAFQQESQQLRQCLQPLQPRIEHIGSTAVEGLGGKPVIDILVGCPAVEDLDKAVPLLQEHGYCYYPCFEAEFRDRRFFARLKAFPATAFHDLDELPDREQHPPSHHLHLVAYDSVFWKRHLSFRDYLRQHPIARDSYYRMKVKLAKGIWESHADYAQAKRAFIRQIERLAELGL